MPRRAGFYIDGFNFYHAVDDLGRPHLKWMSYARLARLLLAKDESVEHVKVFSAVAHWRPSSAARHQVFMAACAAEGAAWVMGEFKQNASRCKGCGREFLVHKEKETDVNIALHLLDDAHRDRIDVAYIVTTDSDLAAAARLLRANFSSIEMVTVSTPNRRHSKEMLAACHRKARATVPMVQSCLLPREVPAPGGGVIVRPQEYDPPLSP